MKDLALVRTFKSLFEGFGVERDKVGAAGAIFKTKFGLKIPSTIVDGLLSLGLAWFNLENLAHDFFGFEVLFAISK